MKKLSDTMKEKQGQYLKLQRFEEMTDISAPYKTIGADKTTSKICKILLVVNKLKIVSKIVVSGCEHPQKLYGINVVKYDADLFSDNQVFVIASTLYADEIYDRLIRDGKKNIVGLSDAFENEMDSYPKYYGQLRRKQICENMISISKKREDEPVADWDIAFITPPYWDMYAPFSAVPCLKAWLKEKGYEAFQIDMSIICSRCAIQKYGKIVMEELLSEKFYDSVIRKYKNNRYSTYQSYYMAMDFLREDIFDVDKIKGAYRHFDFEKKCVTDEFYRRIYIRETNGLEIDFDVCGNIDETLEEAMPLTLYDSFDWKEVKYFFSHIPDIVGISITSTSQFILGCTIAGLIRDMKPNTKIIFGGSCADLFVKSEYKNKVDIFKYFDYVLVGEGETALLKLPQQLQGKSKDMVPNLLYEDAGKIRQTSLIVEDVCTLPPPDYDNLDLSLYLAPEPVLPYQSSRGCHYGQCAFCNHDEKYRHSYRSKHMKKVVEDMVFLSEKYNVHCFQFVDEAIRPDCFRLMIDEMEQNERFQGITWFFYSRVSGSYDENLVKRAAKNGCRMVMFGVESFNQRLLSFIKKGISAETSKYCLRLFHKNHIKTYAWLMDNLPSETLEEAYEDLEEVKRMISYIDAFSVGPFMLQKNTDMYKDLEAYNILETDENDTRRFQSHYKGNMIDKDEMLKFHREKYSAFQRETFLTGNRYTLFFS